MKSKILVMIVATLLLQSALASAETYFYAGSEAVATKEDGEIHYLYHDRLGTETGTYTLPFGQTIIRGDRLGFTGKELDQSMLHHFGARYYDSDTGRFGSKDPLPGQAVYQYVNNNPINLVDPDGMETRNRAHYNTYMLSIHYKPSDDNTGFRPTFNVGSYIRDDISVLMYTGESAASVRVKDFSAEKVTFAVVHQGKKAPGRERDFSSDADYPHLEKWGYLIGGEEGVSVRLAGGLGDIVGGLQASTKETFELSAIRESEEAFGIIRIRPAGKHGPAILKVRLPANMVDEPEFHIITKNNLNEKYGMHNLQRFYPFHGMNNPQPGVHYISLDGTNGLGEILPPEELLIGTTIGTKNGEIRTTFGYYDNTPAPLIDNTATDGALVYDHWSYTAYHQGDE